MLNYSKSLSFLRSKNISIVIQKKTNSISRQLIYIIYDVYNIENDFLQKEGGWSIIDDGQHFSIIYNNLFTCFNINRYFNNDVINLIFIGDLTKLNITNYRLNNIS